MNSVPTNFSAAIKASHYSSTAAANDGVSAVTVDIRLVKTNPRPFESVLKCHSYENKKHVTFAFTLLGIKINGSNSPLQRAQGFTGRDFSLGGH
jgi:hypothetical protein